MPSDDDATPNGSRRAQRARGRHIWHRSLTAGVAVALLAAGTAFAVTGPLQSDDGHSTSRSDSVTGVPASGAAAGNTCRAPLDPGDPLRLWIGGDSLAGSLGPSLGELAGKTGVVQPVLDSRVSSGLLSPDFVNWPKRGGEDMFTYNPEVTVFIVGANDAKNLAEGATRDPKWRTQYSALVEEMLAVLGGNGRAVYWIGAPVMADAAYSERVKGVNEVFQEVAAKHPDVTYVDAYSVFSTPDGAFASMLPVPGGRRLVCAAPTASTSPPKAATCSPKRCSNASTPRARSRSRRCPASSSRPSKPREARRCRDHAGIRPPRRRSRPARARAGRAAPHARR
ncbi:MAG TPA: GDSL-type esterase/lipase family protein [Acidimicrobiia bacterium]|nr:GDSL-type esterase/lipase family protein [Acidimicrobiia bacterium]